MIIRLLEESDTIAYRGLRLEALQDSPDAFATTYEDEIKKSLEDYRDRLSRKDFCTFDDGQLVGVVSLIREQARKLRHRSSIVAMYVTPEGRRKRVGKNLMQSAIQYAKQIEGIEQIYLSVVTTNTAAIKLYHSLGFEIFGTEKRALKSSDSTYWDEYHMVLYL
ncbi:GNAT family N-acetyltransferase [Rummeliibacillus pycnus]|uniref:GNAT family N-acetyltransferase n=1 Tax=Rummeliibacillus pycnus TaxID=101070 RepID=UPI000C9CA496|nr:GNAT family N-acetyltransferase [Rummeliibacillus pycnus]